MKTTSDSLPLAPGELVPAQAVELARQVDYVVGSVVSRTIAKKPTGTITLFAFDLGQGLSEHSAPYDAFVQVVDGVVTLRIGGNDVVGKAGEVVVMRANIPHAVHDLRKPRIGAGRSILTKVGDACQGQAHELHQSCRDI